MVVQNLSDLHVAAEAVSEDRCSFRGRPKRRCKRLFGHGHADVVVLVFEPKIAGNPAASICLRDCADSESLKGRRLGGGSKGGVLMTVRLYCD